MTSYHDLEIVPPKPQGVDRDFPGPCVKTDYAPGEKAAFQAVRQRLDRPLQVCGIAPLQPQERHDPASYEADLLAVVAQHTERFTTFDASHGPLLRKYANQIVADAMHEPARKGELREVRTTDRSGREITEYVGSKKSWMQHFEGPTMLGTFYVNGQPQRV
ncbi:hypothetical protein R75471_05524 [Paraburkholderia domus]|uniref:hypothetical protein n=1 Tax=Paraburkholderia domus TaxID=2793075 RepID=UPI001B2B53F0|nr:hypothetical protein [Paraburkholderia domus]CAE6944127.1 hypothetical protein R75471_05524 [Paraburkholderia domus]